MQKIELQKVTRRIGSVIRLKPEYEDKYIDLHKNTFPGVLDRIKQSNIRNYSIFLLEGFLFSHYEYVGDDYKADMNALADLVTKVWWKLTDPMQEPLPSRKKNEWWAEVDLLLHFGESIKPYSNAKWFAYTAEIKPGLEKIVKNIFSGFNEQLKSSFGDANIQNHNVYYKDDIWLNGKPEVEKFNNELGDNLKAQWQQMKEVFHTD